MTKITLKTALMLGILAVLIVSIAGCANTSNTNQTPSATSSATTSAATQHDVFLEKFITASKNALYSDSNTQVQAWEVDWINSTSAHVQLTALNKTLGRAANIDQTLVVFPTTQDATNYVNAMNAGYHLAGTAPPSGGAYQNVTGHAPQVYKAYANIEGSPLNISSIKVHEIQQLDNVVAVQTAKILS